MQLREWIDRQRFPESILYMQKKRFFKHAIEKGRKKSCTNTAEMFINIPIS